MTPAPIRAASDTLGEAEARRQGYAAGFDEASKRSGARIAGLEAEVARVVAAGNRQYEAACRANGERDTAYARGAAAMREAAATDMDCGCAYRWRVLDVLAKEGEREARKLCRGYDLCAALQAAAIRALPVPEERAASEDKREPWEVFRDYCS